MIAAIGESAEGLVVDPDATLVAVADSVADSPASAGLLARRGKAWEVRTTRAGETRSVLTALLSHAAHAGGGSVSWFVPAATEDHHRAAAASELIPTRKLFQMRCALPLDVHATVEVRPYEPDRDREAWLTANNRAFAWHPDQGGWSGEDVRSRESDSWFDADGFLLHEVDGRLAAFCWTKIHTANEPPLGEIYVIAVDPDFRGHGLGRELTLAGLDHLSDRGLGVGMLYVEHDNEAAVGLYRDLGFHIHHEDVFFTGTIP